MARAYYVLRYTDGRYVGSPPSTTTRNPHLAGCHTSEADAWRCAEQHGIHAEIVPFEPAARAWFAAGRPMD